MRRRVRPAADRCGHHFPAHAHFLGARPHRDPLRRMDYRAAVAGLSRYSRGGKTDASVGGENAQPIRQNHCSNRWTLIASLGAAAWNHSLVTAAQASRKLDMGDTKRGGILFIVTLSFLIVHGINAMQTALLSRQRLDLPDNLSARRIYTQVSVIRKIIITAVVIIATGSVLMLFDPVRQFGTSILASAGIAGIVIGFAAQRTLGNVLAGIQIALTQPLLLDDIVVVEGEFGQIEEITLTYVTVRTWDLRRMILPITYFVEKPFQNWSRVSTDLLGAVVLYLDYQAPIGELRKELKRLVENNPKWDRKVCGLQVTDTKQTTIEVRALVSASNPGRVFDLRCEVREGLIEFLCHNHPESLPRQRNVSQPPDEGIQHRRKSKSALVVQGREHERGPTAPGIHAELDSDGAGS